MTGTPEGRYCREAAAGNERVAREKFAAALHLDPSMPHTHCAWARMEAEAGNIQRAREVYQEGAECAPGHAPLLHVRGGVMG